MSTGSPVLKNFINGMWKPIGGGDGGRGFPEPTEELENCVMVCMRSEEPIEVITETHWIITEQTAFDKDYLTNVDVSYLIANTTVIVSFDGEEYNCEVIEDDGSFGVYNANPQFYFQYNLNDPDTYIYFATYKGDQSEHTISMRYEEETLVYGYSWVPVDIDLYNETKPSAQPEQPGGSGVSDNVNG